MRTSLILGACAMIISCAGHAALDAPIATGKMLGNTCAACHGTFGKSSDEYMPSLAGIDRQQFVRAMRDYRDDKRASVVMNRIAKGYNDREIEAIAEYFFRIR
jgi:cytochrome subunit of sulfide dehydrogenase